MKRSFLTILFAVALIAQVSAQQLRFNDNHLFKIVQLTDTHYIADDSRSLAVLDCIDRVVAIEKPDLIVVTGDVIFGRPAAESIKQVIGRISATGVPFAVTFGNHDDEFDMSRTELLKLINTFAGSLTSTTEGIDGVTNYALSVAPSSGAGDRVILYIFDSLAYSPIEGIGGYNYIHRSQTEWYTNLSRTCAERNGHRVPALAFFHIPLPEYSTAATDERVMMRGTRTEACASSDLNSGLFTAFKECGDVEGVFVGHDHDNDYVAWYKGIALCYGRMSGGQTVYNHLRPSNGARVIELNEQGEGFTTWVRLSNGEKIDLTTIPDDFKR